MSKKLDSFKVGRIRDLRIKLKDQDKQEIKILYKNNIPIREIARIFNFVSRRSIQFILFPERLKTVNYPGHWQKYYDKEKHRLYMSKHRKYKREILKEIK